MRPARLKKKVTSNTCERTSNNLLERRHKRERVHVRGHPYTHATHKQGEGGGVYMYGVCIPKDGREESCITYT